MKPQEKLNRSARAHGWANWSEVLMHNAPAHVINLIVEEAMRGEPDREPEPDWKSWRNQKLASGFKWHNTKGMTSEPVEPALTWRPGARVRITRSTDHHRFGINETVCVLWFIDEDRWFCARHEHSSFGYAVHESDAVVVG